MDKCLYQRPSDEIPNQNVYKHSGILRNGRDNCARICYFTEYRSSLFKEGTPSCSLLLHMELIEIYRGASIA